MSTLQLLTETAQILPMAGDDLIGFANDKVLDIGQLFRNATIVGGTGLVLFTAWVTRMNLSKVVIALFTAGVLIWGVWNITDVRDRVDNEMNASADVPPPPTSPV